MIVFRFKFAPILLSSTKPTMPSRWLRTSSCSTSESSMSLTRSPSKVGVVWSVGC